MYARNAYTAQPRVYVAMSVGNEDASRIRFKGVNVALQ